jgi:hypothetical protein
MYEMQMLVKTEWWNYIQETGKEVLKFPLEHAMKVHRGVKV